LSRAFFAPWPRKAYWPHHLCWLEQRKTAQPELCELQRSAGTLTIIPCYPAVMYQQCLLEQVAAGQVLEATDYSCLDAWEASKSPEARK